MPFSNRPKLRRRAIARVSVAALIAVLLIGAPAAGQVTAAAPAAAAAAAAAAHWRAATAGPQVKYYVVQSGYQGKPEFLFEIADRFLGDGNRNPEIFALNVGRLQADGR
jgi:hypothetical protein